MGDVVKRLAKALAMKKAENSARLEFEKSRMALQKKRDEIATCQAGIDVKVRALARPSNPISLSNAATVEAREAVERYLFLEEASKLLREFDKFLKESPKSSTRERKAFTQSFSAFKERFRQLDKHYIGEPDALRNWYRSKSHQATKKCLRDLVSLVRHSPWDLSQEGQFAENVSALGVHAKALDGIRQSIEAGFWITKTDPSRFNDLAMLANEMMRLKALGKEEAACLSALGETRNKLAKIPVDTLADAPK